MTQISNQANFLGLLKSNHYSLSNINPKGKKKKKTIVLLKPFVRTKNEVSRIVPPEDESEQFNSPPKNLSAT